MKWLVVLLALAAPAAAEPSYRGKGVVGVWLGTTPGAMAVGYGSTGYDPTKRKLEWRVVYDNGQVFRGLPLTGLADLAPGQADAGGTWGTYAPDGAARYDGATERLVRKGDDLLVDQRVFVRAAPVDGVRLDGAYTYLDPDDKDLDGAGCRQVLELRPDGTFVDRGIFVSSCAAPTRTAADAPGAGTYEARDFSLVLRYQDGRTARRSFSPVLRGDVHKDAAAMFVLGQLWRKRARPLAARVASPIPLIKQTEVAFDVVAFAPPPGKETRLANTIGYTAIDPATRSFCATSIFNSVPAARTPEEDFAAEWKDTIGHSYQVAASPPHATGTTPSGLPYTFGASPAVKGDKHWYGQLLVFSLAGRRLSIQVISPDEASAAGCLAQITPMLASLRPR
jgi:hypothetical protein